MDTNKYGITNFIRERKKNDIMRENNKGNQLWFERSGRASLRRWYLSQDWRKKKNQPSKIGDQSISDGGSSKDKSRDAGACTVFYEWWLLSDGIGEGKNKTLRPWELWFYSKWTPKPKQDGDNPHYVLKRSLSRFEEGKNESRTPTEVDIVAVQSRGGGDWGLGQWRRREMCLKIEPELFRKRR